jgi:hypothetical protein
MRIKQISVFIENKKGRLADVCGTLAEHSINIRALSLAETTDFGILRLIVNEPHKCTEILTQSGFTARETDVIAVEVSDTPGGLAAVLKVFDDASINVEYMYAFVEKSSDNAIVIFKVDDEENALSALGAKNIKTVSSEVLNSL